MKLVLSARRASDEADEEGDEADEFASLVQQFTFHKGEKVRVWWESVGVWLVGEIDRVMDNLWKCTMRRPSPSPTSLLLTFSGHQR